MKSRLPALWNTGLMLAVVGALLTVPSMTAAQTIKRDPLTTVRFGAGGVEIGVSVRDVSEADAKSAKLTSPAGAFIESVRAETPAARAGFRAEDVITTFDGERVRSAAHFARLVDETPDGRPVPVTVQRGAERLTLTVAPESSFGVRTLTFDRAPLVASREFLTPKLAPETFSFRSSPLVQMLGGPARLGVSAQDLTEQLREYFGASAGVLVTSVNDDSPARTAGLRAGDVITRINGQATSSTADLRRAIGEASGEVSLTVIRDRKEQTLKVTLGENKLVTTPVIKR